MYWSELLGKLDAVRSAIRQVPNFSKTLVPEGHPILDQLLDISTAVSVVEVKRQITLDVGPDGKPIIPVDLQDVFALAPEPEEPIASNTRRIDTKSNVTKAAPKGSEMKTTMVPRQDDVKHINHPPVLTDATESTVAE